MSAPRIILASLPSFCRTLSKLVKIWQVLTNTNLHSFWDTVYMLLRWRRFTGNSLFTPPTRTWQTVLSCLVLFVSAVWTELASRQDSFVLPWPSFQFATVQSHIYWGLLKTWKLETVLSCSQLCSHRWHGQDKTLTVMSCPCRRCEQAITVSVVGSYRFVFTDGTRKLQDLYHLDMSR